MSAVVTILNFVPDLPYPGQISGTTALNIPTALFVVTDNKHQYITSAVYQNCVQIIQITGCEFRCLSPEFQEFLHEFDRPLKYQTQCEIHDKGTFFLTKHDHGTQSVGVFVKLVG